MKYPIAHGLLLKNKDACIDAVQELVHGFKIDGFPHTSESYNCCKRDVTFVVDAYIQGLEHGNNSRLEYVASRYWHNKKTVLIGRQEKEIIAHQFLKSYILEKVFTDQCEHDAVEKIKNNCDYLIDIIKNGNPKTYLIDLLKNRFTTKNWDTSRTVTDDQIDYILECLNISPAKMAYPGYELVILTDSEEGKKLKNWLFYEHSWTSNGNRKIDSDKERDYKGQYMAPLVLCFFNNLNVPRRGIMIGAHGPQETNLPNEGHRDANIFMSCMTAILAAEELGLNTGISTCHDMIEVAEHFGMHGYRCTIALGVGYALDQMDLLLNDGWCTDVIDPVTKQKVGNLVANIPPGDEKPVRVSRPNIKEITKFI